MDVAERLRSLGSLRKIILNRETEIYSALKADLQKPEIEAYAGEIGPCLDEIDIIERNLKSWSRRKRVRTDWWKLGHFLGSSFIQPVPLGRVLVIGPWNYPFQLALIPVIGAFAAGNQITLKPSEFAPATSRLLKSLIEEWISADFVQVIEGDSQISQKLCAEEWGMIFFTGGTATGRKIMTAAAQTLSPVTLELGGKSPCIIDEQIPLEPALTRIFWGKCFNAGQTCVAPDYLLIPQSRHDEAILIFKALLKKFYPQGAPTSADYARIINRSHFDRLERFLNGGQIVVGGERDHSTLKFSPTILSKVDLKSPLMTEEIFGPLLPVVTYSKIEEALQIVQARPNPLALYLFSNDRELQDRIVNEIPFGGACINDVIVHLSNPNLPFGGIRTSGMGAYHGFKSFEIFSHWKSVERKSLRADLKLRYPPYKIKLNRFLKKFI